MALVNCPICWEALDTQVNCLTTQCGHQFHGNCFMMHTAHNGYSCPCCRHQLIEEPDKGLDDSEYESDDDEEEFNHNDGDSVDSQYRRNYNFGRMFMTDEDESLFSLRWFHQRLNEEELEKDNFHLSNMNDVTDYNDTDVIYDENKDQVQQLTKRITEINKLPYERLLAAFMHKNCKDFRYNDYAEEMCYDVSHMINDIHERMLRSS